MSDRLTPSELLATFQGYGTPRARWRVGGEFERALVRPDGSAVRYFDEDGIRWLLERYAAASGWKPKYEGGNPIELRAPDDIGNLSLEPGGQVELSGSPHARLSALADEVRADRALLHRIVEGKDSRWISCGLTPFARIEDIPFVPKGRYAVMREYLPSHGPLAHWMMKGTCSVQTNFDYADEEDCARKFRVSLDLAPLNTAIFANSPLSEGKPTGYASYRAHIWTQTDPDRTGFPPAVRAGYTHARWVDYLLDTPMMFYLRDGRWTPANGTTFRTWMERGIDGAFPSVDDWVLHQTSVFPEVRVKRVIEIRGADAVDVDLAVAFCALWTGLLYGALGDAEEIARRFAAAEGTPEEKHVAAARGGMDATFGRGTGAEWARGLVEVARQGLAAIGESTSLLDPLAARVESGRSPYRDVLEAYERDPSPASVLAAVAY